MRPPNKALERFFETALAFARGETDAAPVHPKEEELRLARELIVGLAKRLNYRPTCTCASCILFHEYFRLTGMFPLDKDTDS